MSRFWLLLLLTLLLQACASPKYGEEVVRGKYYFEDGNFKLAFKTLLPAAVSGNPQAEYAIGYMYFYGYGVPQDSDTGLFWMEKSAEQGYLPAIKALNLIKKQSTSVKERVEAAEPLPVNPPREPIVRADGYGLQLFGSYDLNAVKQLQRDVDKHNFTVIWHTEYHGRDWYVLMYGHYKTCAAARKAIVEMPRKLQELHPWVRDFKSLG